MEGLNTHWDWARADVNLFAGHKAGFLYLNLHGLNKACRLAFEFTMRRQKKTSIPIRKML